MGTNGRLCVRPLCPQEKRSWCPLGGPRGRSGHGGKEGDSQPLPGLEPPIIQPVAQGYNTELSRLLLLIGSSRNSVPKVTLLTEHVRSAIIHLIYIQEVPGSNTCSGNQLP
jgi:hypothetical protein